jgi:chromosome segregation ATPase
MLDESLISEITRQKNTAGNSEFTSHNAERPPEMQSHFSRLSNLVNKLKSITDQASDGNGDPSSLSQDFELLVIAASREAECADFIEKSMETDLTSLCEEIKQKNEALADQKTTIENLELRLREQEEKLAIQEKEVNEKHCDILAASAREAEIGKLIERLSSECERLSADLCEKSLIISRFETKPHYSLTKGGKAWGRLLRLLGMARPSLASSNPA